MLGVVGDFDVDRGRGVGGGGWAVLGEGVFGLKEGFEMDL